MVKQLHVALPLGIGDCYWVMTKLEALKRRSNAQNLIVHVSESPNHKSENFICLAPFVDRVVLNTNVPHVVHLPQGHRHERWSTLGGSKSTTFDYILQANGHLELEKPLRDWLPELGEPNYHFPLSLGPSRWPRRVLCYASGTGPNKGFNTNFGKREWQDVVKRINWYGFTPAFVGANTPDDLGFYQSLDLDPDEHENLVGKTTTKEYMEIINECRLWIGLNSGGGIMSVAMRRPTIMLWSDIAYGGQLPTGMKRTWTDDPADYFAPSYNSPDLMSEINRLLKQFLGGDDVGTGSSASQSEG